MANPIKTLRNKTDRLLTPWIVGKYKKCELCNMPAQVAHHHIHKSQSSRLRYEEKNLIPLCHPCHCKLHHNESYYASKIVSNRGIKWFEELEKMKHEIIKTNKDFYQTNYDRIKWEIDHKKQ